MKRLCAPMLVLGMALGSGAAAQGLDGHYQPNLCRPGAQESQIEIRGNEIRFWESTCQLSNPVPVRDMQGAVLYDAACSGEGMTWTVRYLLMTVADRGLVIVGDGWGGRFAYCGP